MTPESIRVTLYRLEELPDLEHAVKLNDDITKNQTIVGGRNAIVCYGEKETKRAWWSEGFEAISNLKLEDVNLDSIYKEKNSQIDTFTEKINHIFRRIPLLLLNQKDFLEYVLS